VLGVGTLSGGTASYTTSTLTVGTHSLTASYGGDSTFNASLSTSNSVDVTLTAPILVQVSDNAGDTATQTLNVTVK